MAPPTQIGQYEILGIIGRGAMGVVYRAQDTKMFRRLVAIKVISENLIGDADALRRFHVEQETVASLQHPNIVTIYDRGEFEDRQYFVMEYLEGCDLAHLICERDSRTRDQRIEIAIQIAEALDFAHRREVIHRDIKPTNVMVIRRGDLNQAKLLDFGIVHVSRKGMTTTVTQPGTLLYMSPEQLRSQPVSSRSDLFSLGLVLFELFVGVHPFGAASEPLITAKILYEPPLSARDQDPNTPVELDALLAALLQKDPAKRPASAGLVATELRRVLRGLSEAPTTDPPRIALLEPHAAGVEPPPMSLTASEPRRRLSDPEASRPSRVLKIGVGFAVAVVLIVAGWRGVHWWNLRRVERQIEVLIKEAGQLVDGPEGQAQASDPTKLDRALKDLVSAGTTLNEALGFNPSHGPAKEMQGRLRAIRGELERRQNTLKQETDNKVQAVASFLQQAQQFANSAAKAVGGEKVQRDQGLSDCIAAQTWIAKVTTGDPDNVQALRLLKQIEGIRIQLGSPDTPGPATDPKRTTVAIEAARNNLTIATNALASDDPAALNRGLVACAIADSKLEEIPAADPRSGDVSALRKQCAELRSSLNARLESVGLEKHDRVSVKMDAWEAQAAWHLDRAERLLGQGGRDNALAGQEECAAATTPIESIRKEQPEDERIARLQHRQENLTRRLADALSQLDKASDDLSDLFDRLNTTSSMPAPANELDLKARVRELQQISDDLESRGGPPRAAELRRKLDGATRQLGAFKTFFAYLDAYNALDFKRLQDIFPRAPVEIKGSFEDLRRWDATSKNVFLNLDGDAGTLRCRLHENILTRTSGPQALTVDLTLVLERGSEGWVIREHRIVPVSGR